MWLWPRPIFVPSGIYLDPSNRLATTDMGRKLGGGLCPLGEGWSWVRIRHNVARAEGYLRTKWHLDLSNRLATISMGRKVGAVPLFREELGPHLTQCGLG